MTTQIFDHPDVMKMEKPAISTVHIAIVGYRRCQRIFYSAVSMEQSGWTKPSIPFRRNHRQWPI